MSKNITAMRDGVKRDDFTEETFKYAKKYGWEKVVEKPKTAKKATSKKKKDEDTTEKNG